MDYEERYAELLRVAAAREMEARKRAEAPGWSFYYMAEAGGESYIADTIISHVPGAPEEGLPDHSLTIE